MPGCALDPHEDGGDEALFWECVLNLKIFATDKTQGKLQEEAGLRPWSEGRLAMRMQGWAESGKSPGGHREASRQVSHEAPRRAAQTVERWSEKEERPREPKGGVGVLKDKRFSPGVGGGGQMRMVKKAKCC